MPAAQVRRSPVRRAAVGRPVHVGARRRRRMRSAGACARRAARRRTTSTCSDRARAGVARRAGLLTSEDAAALDGGAARTSVRQIADGAFVFDLADEDVHSAIERAVTDRLGDVGARLHAGRSRNDLVVTDLRLVAPRSRRRRRSTASTTMLVRTLVARAREHAETVDARHDPRARRADRHARHTICWRMRGRCSATSSALDQWARPDARCRRWAPARWPRRRSASTLPRRPSGSASTAPFDELDRRRDRPGLRAGVPGGRGDLRDAPRRGWPPTLARWTDPALGWAELDEAYTTGSSMMPQKRNPDTAELARAKAARDRRRVRAR